MFQISFELAQALLLGDQTAPVLALDLLRPLVRVVKQTFGFVVRHHDVVDGDAHATAGRELEPDLLDLVDDPRRLVRVLEMPIAVRHHLPELLAAHRVVVVLADLAGSARLKIARPTVVSIRLVSPPSRSVRTMISGVEIDRAGIVGKLHLLQRGEDLAPAPRHCSGRDVRFEIALRGHVVAAENDVLRRRDDRLAVRRREQVADREHSRPRFVLRPPRQRHVDRHLVAVEVRVERSADERVNLDRRAFDQANLERLNAQPVQVGARLRSTT